MAAAEEGWVKVQRKTFVKWTNQHLKRKGFDEMPIDGFAGSWTDGTGVMRIINAVFDVPIPKHNKNAKMRPQAMDNVSISFKMIEEAAVKTNFLQVTHILDADEKMALGLLWSIILTHAVAGITVDEATAKEGLLLWVKKRTKNYNHVDPPGVSNFSSSWKDGMAFCALVHRYRPGMIDYDSLNPKNAAENLETAFAAAEELGIPRLLDVEDITESPRPDERSIITQVSEYFRVMAGDSLKENAANRLANFLKFMREMEDRQNDYIERARAFIAWCNSESERLAGREFGDSLEDAAAAFAAFRTFVTETKPSKVGERLDLDLLYSEIQTELAVNQRFAFVPPEDCTPDAVQAALDAVNEAERERGVAVRNNRFRFVERKEVDVPQEKLDEFKEAFDHFDANNSGTLEKIELKAALTALSVPVRDEDHLTEIYDRLREGEPEVSFDSYIRFNLSLVEDKDTPEQTLAAFEMLNDGAQRVTRDQLLVPPLTEEDVDALVSRMGEPDADGTYDYAAFVNAHFKPSE